MLSTLQSLETEMNVFEILFEGVFDTSLMSDGNSLKNLRGFIALRQISAANLDNAIDRGSKEIYREMERESGDLATALGSVVAIESRALDVAKAKKLTGFTFY